MFKNISRIVMVFQMGGGGRPQTSAFFRIRHFSEKIRGMYRKSSMIDC